MLLNIGYFKKKWKYQPPFDPLEQSVKCKWRWMALQWGQILAASEVTTIFSIPPTDPNFYWSHSDHPSVRQWYKTFFPSLVQKKNKLPHVLVNFFKLVKHLWLRKEPTWVEYNMVPNLTVDFFSNDLINNIDNLFSLVCHHEQDRLS